MWGPKILLMPIPTGGWGVAYWDDFPPAAQAYLRQGTKGIDGWATPLPHCNY